MSNAVAIGPTVSLIAYYDRTSRSWWAFYQHTGTGHQIGDAWFGSTRDDVLIHRPDVPAY